MQYSIEFWNFIFWVSFFLFLFNNTNLLNLLIFAELIWATLYMLSVFFGLINDDLSLISFSFFILTLAAIEFILGLFLVIFFKTFFNNSLFLVNNAKKQWPTTLFNLKKTYFNFIKF